MNDYGWILFSFFITACVVFYVIKRPKKVKEKTNESVQLDSYKEAMADLEYLEKLHSGDEKTIAIVHSLKANVELLNHTGLSKDASAKTFNDSKGNTYNIHEK